MPAATPESFARSLTTLGFSQYEARCYVGLLTGGPQTGYGVAKATGVPQPKVYEALRKLVARSAAEEVAGEPVRFLARAPERLLADLRSSFEGRLAVADEVSRDLAVPAGPPALEPVARLERREDVLGAARAVVAAGERRAYLSASAEEVEALAPAMADAVARGVDLVVLVFGVLHVELPGVRLFRHASTDGALYRAHQARYLALVVDSRETVQAVAADGHAWHGVRTTSAPIIAAVKGFIRHDIDLQRVFADFGPQLVEAYGPGLQELEAYRRDPSAPEAAEQGDPRWATG